ncbi:MAG: hypothetical protein VKM98_07690 [Cyanobacteriota bacterium]|nr:hypothetical protein [Cyanobacteriota bacterium]
MRHQPASTAARPLPVVCCCSALALALTPWSAGAQWSPNCTRNGRPDHCAITPVAGVSNAKQSRDIVVFADHRAYEVLVDQTSCRRVSRQQESCAATILSPPGNTRAIAASYRRTYYEGGVKHEAIAQGLHLSYVFLD